MQKFYEDNKRLILTIFYVAIAVVIFIWLQQNYLLDKKPSRLVQSTISGILIGGVYSLIALGIVIINKASGVFNFAHGWMMLIGGMIFYSFFTISDISDEGALLLALVTVVMILGTGSFRDLLNPRTLLIGAGAVVILTVLMTIGDKNAQWLHALAGGICGAVLVGLVVERFAIRPLIGQPLFASVLMTLAVSEVLHGVTQVTWGSVELTLPIFQGITNLGLPPTIIIDGSESFLDGRVIIQSQFLVAFVLALIAFGGFILFFQYTNVGLAMRATAENQQLAQSTGLRVRVILSVAWAIATLLAGAAGTLQGGATTLSINMPLIALRAFPAVLLGGLESIGGAFIGGLVIGLVEQWGILLFPNQVGTELLPYIVLMAVLVVRPEGLFGQRRIERI